MQFGQYLKIKMAHPKFLLDSIFYNFRAWLGIKDAQLTLNDVAFSNVKTKRFTIGWIGSSDCDFKFASAANTTEQVIDLGAIIPAYARVLDIKLHTEIGFTGVTTFVAEVGNSSSGNQFIASATVKARNVVLSMAHTAALNAAPAATASHVYVAATPGTNWSGMAQGRLAVHITYVEANEVDDDDTTTTTTTTTTAAPTTTTTTTTSGG